MTAERLLRDATERHRSGDRAAARGLYQALLDGAPAHARGWFQFGLLELQEGHAERALTLIERAATLTPHEPRYQLARGQALQALDRFAEAANAYRTVVSAGMTGSQGHAADAHFGLGLALQAQEDHHAAISAYQQAVLADPDHFAAFNNLGNCLQRCGHIDEAANAYSRALVLKPEAVGTLANLGTVLQHLGQLDEAVELLRRAAAREPLVSAHAVNLGIALNRRRDFTAALDVLGAVLAREPACSSAWFNMGNALSGLKRLSEAAAAYQRAAELEPTHADAWINLGNMHADLAEPAAAATCYEAALRAAPDSVVARNNWACLLRTVGQLDAAEDLLRQALERDPHHAAAADNLGSVLKDLGALDEAMAFFRRSLALEPDSAATHSNLAYALSFVSMSAAPVLAECLRWGRAFGTAPAVAAADIATPRPSVRDPRTDRRLRVGYVSADFREHCQSLFTLPLLANHDRTNVEIFCYSSVRLADGRTREIAGLADVFRDVRSQDDAALAATIRADRIDILVDLTMHMAGGRLRAFAAKPAPVQIAWLAYPGTTGLPAMDYRISDPRLDPADFDAHYSERTLRLPDSFWCYDPLSPPLDVGELPALERGYLTFGCLNNPCKLTDATLQLWRGVFDALPTARLALLAPSGRHAGHLRERLRRHGIEPDRVELLPYRKRREYLESYRDIDLGLDTVPYNGHTTSLDALWMGVPTLTRVGATAVGRGGLSQLTQLDLTEFAADSDSALIATASCVSRDLDRLNGLRRDLRARLTRSPLMDAPRFARNLETLYRTAWTDACASTARAT